MSTCRECGHRGRPSARFCTQCGATVQPVLAQPAARPDAAYVPTPRPVPVRSNGSGRRRGPFGLTAALAAGLAIVAVVAVVAVFGNVSRAANPSPAPLYPPANATDTYPPTTTPTDAVSAKEELDRQVAEDRPAVEALVGQWIPQLSAKRPGLVVHGITFDHLEVLRDFHALQSRYPEVLLLYSGEYSSFRYGDFWITVMPLPQPDGESANAWCDGQAIGPDDCYAKLISHTAGYQDSTLHR